MNDHAPVSANTNEVRIRGNGYTAEAGWFGPEDRPRFGWLYRPDRPAPNGVGVVIVPPFGAEAICAHRSLRHLAENAARAGHVAIRFDLDGTGDSAGDDHDSDRVAAWLASIHDACNLVRCSGATRLVLIGTRLGATLAALASQSRQDIAALITINAVIRGRDFLREARALQATMGLRPPPRPAPDNGGQEVNGFAISPETHSRLGLIDLCQETAPRAPAVLMIERDDMPERKKWPDQLREHGIDVQVTRLAGVREMLDPPHLAIVSTAVVNACIDYLESVPRTGDIAADAVTPESLRPCISLETNGVVITERVVMIEASLFGIVTETPAKSSRRDSILLLNAGANTHGGPNRLYVTWARCWAAAGSRVLRADLTGIGDSPTQHDAPENRVYGPLGIPDTITLTDWLRHSGTGRIAVGGVCSGGYHALRSAIAGAQADAVFMVNPGALRDIGVITNEATEQVQNSYYSNQIKSGQVWRKLARVTPGKLWQVAKWYLSTYGGTALRETARRLHLPMRDDLGSELQTLAQRDVQTHFVFSADDPSRALLTANAGSVVGSLMRAGKLTVDLVDGPNHTFTQCWSHQPLQQTLGRILFTKAPPHQ